MPHYYACLSFSCLPPLILRRYATRAVSRPPLRLMSLRRYAADYVAILITPLFRLTFIITLFNMITYVY